MPLELENLIDFCLAHPIPEGEPDLDKFTALLIKADVSLEGIEDWDSTQAAEYRSDTRDRGMDVCMGQNKKMFTLFPATPTPVISRFARANLIIEGVHYDSVERAFQDANACKYAHTTLRMLKRIVELAPIHTLAVWAEDYEAMDQVRTESPMRVRVPGTTFIMLLDFAKGHTSVMAILTYLKFRQSAPLRRILLRTHGTTLVECSNKDTIYSCGLHFNNPLRNDPAAYPGRNNYGLILTAIRDHMMMRGDRYYS